mmetsp:Transcript_28978/g.40617  ORF Transcript_28978/g.40617 Transcript_28978/m.40617 type:complete len:203 (+) Transcript_28978:703-1311(+)
MNEFLSIIITHVLDHVLIQRINKIEHFNVLVVEFFHELTVFKIIDRTTSNDVNILLPVLHSLDIIFQTNEAFLFFRLGRVETKKFCEFATVRFILNNSKFDAWSELFVPLNVRVLFLFLWGRVFNDVSVGINFSLGSVFLFLNCLLGKIADHFNGLSNKFLLDYLDNLRFLKSFTIDVEGEILRVNHTLNKGKVARHEFKLV